MKLFTILIFLISLLFVSVPCQANIHGELSFKYELGDFNSGQSWVVDVYQNWGKFDLGAKQTCFTNGYGTYFNMVPAFFPTNQLYEMYIRFNVNDNTYIQITQWCNHPVFSGYLTTLDVPSGINVEGCYKF